MRPAKVIALVLLLCVPCLSRAQDFLFIPPQLPDPLYHDPDTVTLVFAGDIMMHSEQISNARRGADFDFSAYFPEVAGLFKNADLAVANLEFTLAGEPYSGYPCFSAPDSYADYIADCGVDIFLTANNHILDKGRKGIERTLGIYDRMEAEGLARHTGCALDEADDSLRNPLVIPVKGIRIAFLNFTYGTNSKLAAEFPKVCGIDTTALSKAIGKARRRGAEYIIALPHWGVEYSLTHNKAQRQLADWLARKGCDAVIGAHPHVVQDTETIPATGPDGRIVDVPVIYSLGNLISNMSARNTQVGMLATLRIAIDKCGGHKLLPPSLTLTWCSRPGGLTDSYTTVPVRPFSDRNDLWKNSGDHTKMTLSYERVKSATGIADDR